MFNGIVETVGIITHIELKNDNVDLTIHAKDGFHDLVVGESVAVNGVCLTVTHFLKNVFRVCVVPETRRLTNLHDKILGEKVNLERSLKVDARLSGHYVQGHVDGVGTLVDLKEDGNSDAKLVTISLPENLIHYVVEKGYIALDGMSITVISIEKNQVTVTFIPHTQDVTIIHQYKKGTKINIEVDILSKYVEKLLGVREVCNQASNALQML